MISGQIARARLLAVFLVALVGLGVCAGARLFRPSKDNHFVHMAQGWLEGRLALPDKPPGWCDERMRVRGECKGPSYDDWAVVYEVELRDGSRARGIRCSTRACQDARRRDGVQTWWILGEGWREFERREVVRASDTWYVSFPPGPAAVMLPVVAIAGLRTPDVLLTAIAAAFIPLVLVRLLDRERGVERGRGREHLWVAAAWTFASPALLMGAHGRVWFTAQIFAALFLVLHLDAAWRVRRPLLAGIFLALAIACRPINMLMVVPFFALEWWREGRRTKDLVRFAVPIAVVGIAMAALNWVRFDDPFEFGHRFLDMRWQARVQETGLFSGVYLGRNLQCLLTLLPTLDHGALRLSIHGSALWLGSPWIAAAALARERFPQRLGLWLAAGLAALPSLFYQNSGQLQTTYRFAADWLPLVLVAIACGGGARRRVFAPLVVAGIVFSAWTTWQFSRAPGRLFVVDPMGWPFESEYQGE